MTAAVRVPGRPLTLDDVTRLAEDDDVHRYELVEGNLIVVPPANWRHQRISAQLVTWLSNCGYADRASIAPGVRTAADNMNGRIPDLVVAAGPVPDDVVWLEPDLVLLAVEVVSKGSERTDRWLKPLEYAEAGIKWFWRVEPDDTVVQLLLVDGRYVEQSRVPLADLLASDVVSL
jgi:Uma2 family endonuclease